jgi:ketosteroid isomerase-like protein
MTTTATRTTPAAVALAADVYAAFGRGDVPAILDRLAPDVAWDAFPDSWAAGLEHLRPRRGPAEVGDFFAILAAWKVVAFDVVSIVGDDRSAVARIASEFELPGGGALRDEELHLWVLDDAGRVTEFRHYVDTAKHLAAARGEDTRAAG